jgi:hypothetical protein
MWVLVLNDTCFGTIGLTTTSPLIYSTHRYDLNYNIIDKIFQTFVDDGPELLFSLCVAYNVLKGEQYVSINSCSNTVDIF